MYLHSAMRNSFGAPPLAEQLYTIVAMTSKLRTMQIFRSSAMRPKLHGERERARARARERECMRARAPHTRTLTDNKRTSNRRSTCCGGAGGSQR